jgi:hypothetical protein
MKKLNVEQMESIQGGWGWHPKVDLPTDADTCAAKIAFHKSAGGWKGFLGALFITLYCKYHVEGF